ncbi:hypothetical protein L596_023501 [Steinernema carpocapsae]|uniref:Uncharacterized protein n=1 Tax=Steinernema carpocapsae TaxID=34508 RepID=A0A4U5MDT7_STECR|nr:hypothetical protein L596_023501 [Steinernema carpocapsae]
MSKIPYWTSFMGKIQNAVEVSFSKNSDEAEVEHFKSSRIYKFGHQVSSLIVATSSFFQRHHNQFLRTLVATSMRSLTEFFMLQIALNCSVLKYIFVVCPLESLVNECIPRYNFFRLMNGLIMMYIPASSTLFSILNVSKMIDFKVFTEHSFWSLSRRGRSDPQS